MKLSWLDEYERRARMIPGLLALAPIVVVIIALGLRQNIVVAGISGALSTFGGPVVLANYVRRRGLAVQDRLWPEWGGPPTTAMLRHRGPVAEAAQRDRLRVHVASLLRLKLPAAVEEQADPDAADAAYAAAIRQLINRIGSKKQSRLVFEENKNYGYERNLVGMRPPGHFLVAVAGVVLIVTAVLATTHTISISASDPIMGALVEGAVVLFWLIVPNEDQVRRVGEAYASRLAEAALARPAKGGRQEAMSIIKSFATVFFVGATRKGSTRWRLSLCREVMLCGSTCGAQRASRSASRALA